LRAATATLGRSASFIEFNTPPDNGVRSKRVNAPFFFPELFDEGVADDVAFSDCRGNDSSDTGFDPSAPGSANGTPVASETEADGFDAIRDRSGDVGSDDDEDAPLGAPFAPPAAPVDAGLLPEPCFTTAGFATTPPPPGPGPARGLEFAPPGEPVPSGVAASAVAEFAPVAVASLPLTGGANSDTAPYQDARWNPAFVEEEALLFRRAATRASLAFEASREPAGVPGVARDPARDRDPALSRVSPDARAREPGSELVPELVPPPVGVPARAVAGVSTARAGTRVGDPGLGPPDGLVRVGEGGRWLCPPGFAACARAAREATGRARGGAGAGRARAGARDPSLAPVHDADAHDAAIVSFVFSSGRFKKGLSFPRGTRARWTRGGKARGERGEADAGLEAKRGVPEGRPTLVTFAARARARSASGPRDASISNTAAMTGKAVSHAREKGVERRRDWWSRTFASRDETGSHRP
jgi:hypothetical protein